ncbi:MAG: hypothetical protein AB8B57_14430 [Congregibacter sp.]
MSKNKRRLLKIYGERNSNTNHLSVLLRKNCGRVLLPGTAPSYLQWDGTLEPVSEVLRDSFFFLNNARNLGWKHKLPPPTSSFHRFEARFNCELTVITLSKNPYAWLLSLYRKPYHLKVKSHQTFEEFLSQAYTPMRREGLKTNFVSIPELWNIKNRGYSEMAFSRSINITSEDILRDQKSVVSRICALSKIPLKSAQITEHLVSTNDASKDTASYRDYYLNEHWKKQISSDAAQLINKQLDLHLLEKLGYEIYEP